MKSELPSSSKTGSTMEESMVKERMREGAQGEAQRKERKGNGGGGG